MNESLVGETHGWQDGWDLRCVKLGNVDDLSVGEGCVIYGSQTGGGKKVGRGEKELLVVARLGSRGKEEGKKDLLVVTRLGSLAEVMEKKVWVVA